MSGINRMTMIIMVCNITTILTKVLRKRLIIIIVTITIRYIVVVLTAHIVIIV